MLDDVDQQVVADWTAFRRARKSPVTLTVVKILRAEAVKLGITAEQALTICIGNSWLSIKASWPKAAEEANEIRLAAAKAAAPKKEEEQRSYDPEGVTRIKSELSLVASRLRMKV